MWILSVNKRACLFGQREKINSDGAGGINTTLWWRPINASLSELWLRLPDVGGKYLPPCSISLFYSTHIYSNRCGSSVASIMEDVAFGFFFFSSDIPNALSTWKCITRVLYLHLCQRVLTMGAKKALKPSKLKQRSETNHPTLAGKLVDLFKTNGLWCHSAMTNCIKSQSQFNPPGGGGASVCGCVVHLFGGCNDGAESTAMLVWPLELVIYWIPCHTCLGVGLGLGFLFISCSRTWLSWCTVSSSWSPDLKAVLWFIGCVVVYQLCCGLSVVSPRWLSSVPD